MTMQNPKIKRSEIHRSEFKKTIQRNNFGFWFVILPGRVHPEQVHRERASVCLIFAV